MNESNLSSALVLGKRIEDMQLNKNCEFQY